MYVRALAGYEKSSGPEHNETVTVQTNLANLKNTPISKTRRGISRLFKEEQDLIAVMSPIYQGAVRLISGKTGFEKRNRSNAESIFQARPNSIQTVCSL